MQAVSRRPARADSRSAAAPRPPRPGPAARPSSVTTTTLARPAATSVSSKRSPANCRLTASPTRSSGSGGSSTVALNPSTGLDPPSTRPLRRRIGERPLGPLAADLAAALEGEAPGLTPGRLAQPGQEAPRLPELAEAVPDLEVDVLGRVAGQLLVARLGQRDGRDHGAGGAHQPAEGVAVAAGGGQDLGFQGGVGGRGHRVAPGAGGGDTIQSAGPGIPDRGPYRRSGPAVLPPPTSPPSPAPS